MYYEIMQNIIEFINTNTNNFIKLNKNIKKIVFITINLFIFTSCNLNYDNKVIKKDTKILGFEKYSESSIEPVKYKNNMYYMDFFIQ